MKKKCPRDRVFVPAILALLLLVGGLPAQVVTNGDFSQGLAGWTASSLGGTVNPGTVQALSGAAVFLEGDSFFVTLSQSFVIPTTAVSLRFDLFLLPGFDLSSTFIPDAFEVSLTDLGSNPVVPPWNPLATSYFNVQEDGSVLLGAATTFDGTTVTVDLASVPPGTAVTLTFALIGGDFDQGSGVTIDGVDLLALCLAPPASWSNVGTGFPGVLGVPSLTMSGDPVLGTTVLIDVASATGGATSGCALFSFTPANLVFPPLPGTFHVDPLDSLTTTFEIAIPPAGASLPLAIPFDAILCGLTAHLQVLVADATVLGGYAFTPGLTFTIGG